MTYHFDDPDQGARCMCTDQLLNELSELECSFAQALIEECDRQLLRTLWTGIQVLRDLLGACGSAVVPD